MAKLAALPLLHVAKCATENSWKACGSKPLGSAGWLVGALTQVSGARVRFWPLHCDIASMARTTMPLTAAAWTEEKHRVERRRMGNMVRVGRVGRERVCGGWRDEVEGKYTGQDPVYEPEAASYMLG